ATFPSAEFRSVLTACAGWRPLGVGEHGRHTEPSRAQPPDGQNSGKGHEAGANCPTAPSQSRTSLPASSGWLAGPPGPRVSCPPSSDFRSRLLLASTSRPGLSSRPAAKIQAGLLAAEAGGQRPPGSRDGRKIGPRRLAFLNGL